MTLFQAALVHCAALAAVVVANSAVIAVAARSFFIILVVSLFDVESLVGMPPAARTLTRLLICSRTVTPHGAASKEKGKKLDIRPVVRQLCNRQDESEKEQV
jgi:hypothetical protein